MLVQPQPHAKEEDKMPIASSPPPQDPTPKPYAIPLQDQPSTHPALPPQEQPTTTYEYSMSLLTTLMETCTSLSQKVAELEQDKHTQALETLQLKKRGRIDQEDVNAASKGVNVAEPTVFDDEEVTMTMAQTLIKMKAEKAKLLDEQIAQKLLDEEENMIIYLKNMAGYKMEHFRGMTYDKVRPIFEREYKKVQTLFKPDKYVEEPKKKRVADETLLQESFKKLRAAEVSELLPPKKQIHPSSSSSTTLSDSSRKQACILVLPSFSTYTPTPPQIYELGKSSIKIRVKHHEEQIESIKIYLEELSFHRIKKMEERLVNGWIIIPRDFDETKLKEACTQIRELWKKRMGQRDKIAFIHFRISDLEMTLEDI
nr:hypothetical protein [Tanacetum cinerariifolium]